MGRRLSRALILLPVAAGLSVLATSGVGATPPDANAGASSRAFGVNVLVPGQPTQGTPTLSAPQDAVQFGRGFVYPTDGSVVSATAVTLSVSADNGAIATADASAEVTSLKLFNGDITADSVDAKATSTANASQASGAFDGSSFTNLVVLGQPVSSPAPNQRVNLADWGYAILLEQSSAQPQTGPPGFDGYVTALDVHLTADHGGLPAGSEILVGYAKATTQAAAAPPVPTAPSTPATTAGATTTTGPAKAVKRPKTKAPEPTGIPGPVRQPPSVTPKLTAGGYVFPVYGTSSFIDTFGAFRGDVSGDWHHGDDIFAPLAAPLLACASGTVFSVGWNPVGGNRLWIRDSQGNEFYYAHLSAFSPLAKDGAHVNAGDVVGFVGNTGDAKGTPYHLHFEIHPVGLLGLGYDGAVDPTSYLFAWKKLRDLPITDAGAFVVAPAPGAQAPKPGAILLQSSDISSASGLDPASLRRALTPVQSQGDGAVGTKP